MIAVGMVIQKLELLDRVNTFALRRKFKFARGIRIRVHGLLCSQLLCVASQKQDFMAKELRQIKHMTDNRLGDMEHRDLTVKHVSSEAPHSRGH